MDIESLLTEITKINTLAIPSKHAIPKQFEKIGIRSEDTWLIPCSHALYAPITQMQSAELRYKLKEKLPEQLHELLWLTDGADLFKIKYESSQLGEYWVARYKVLNHSALSKVNLELLDTFLSYAEEDPDYLDESLALNYIAFCAVGDGNYLAITTKSPNQGQVFYLDHNYAYYPFGTRHTKHAYFLVADSLLEWLEILLYTKGGFGTGSLFIPL